MTQNFHLSSSAITDKGLSEKRPQNEDAYLEMTNRGLFAVADGVGGAQSGEVASQMAVEVLAEAFGNLQTSKTDIEELMGIAIKSANSAIYQMSHDLPQLQTMATTIVVLQISGNIATIGHVGDSRLYRLDPKGNLFRETQDHSVVEEEVRAGRMTAAQAANHPSRNVISRALGAEGSVEIDMKTIMFDPNTTFLLCSDGITRHLSDIEIREMLLTCNSPVEACREMKNLCYGRGAEDNLTAVVIKVGQTVTESLIENEEPTIANARSASASSNFSNTVEIPTRELQIPTITEPENTKEFINSSSHLSVPTQNSNDGAMFRVEGSSGVGSDDDVRQYEQMQAERAYIIDHSRKENTLGRFFKVLFWMLFGGLLGVLGYYALTEFGSEKPKNTDTINVQSANVPYTSFEDNRRNVDNNPRQFLETSGNSADDAEDFYLVGRANLQLLDYKKAGEAFRKAKEFLPKASETNRKVLETEINMALAMLADSDATKAFEKEKGSAPIQTNANSGVSSANATVKTANVSVNSNITKPTNINAKPINTNVVAKPNTNTTTAGSQKDN